MKKAVEEGFISEANFNDLIISDSCEELIEKVIDHERPHDNDWTNRLGI
jgi:predicted Rossmann-fold nucleotide-binding protein